jgi:hypothetical protein
MTACESIPPTEANQVAEPCRFHAGVLLPVAQRPGEAILCPLCAQEARRRAYAGQLAAWHWRTGQTLNPAHASPGGAGDGGQGPGLGALATGETVES